MNKKADIMIPSLVQKKAEALGYNTVKLIKEEGGTCYYGLSLVDENGMVVPMGLPVVISKTGDDLRIVSGVDALSLL